jgi:hypothetical protein
MLKFIKIEGLESVNASESTFGNPVFLGNKLIIPFYNVKIHQGENSFLNQEKGKFIKYCYLVFEGVLAITWDYDLSRVIGPENRECYGGDYYYDKEHYEFWIKYQKGFIYLDQAYQSSLNPWNDLDERDDVFFKSLPVGLF